MRVPIALTLTSAIFCGFVATPAALSRPDAPTSSDNEARALTAQKLRKTLSIELNDARLEDIVTFITDFSGADIQPMWIDEGGDTGLKKDQRMTIEVKDVSVLTLIERVLAKAETDFSPATWQFAPSGGTLEIGPRGRLNQQAYLKLYDIQDMIFQIPDFADAPRLDLDQVLNQGGQGGGGGGGSVFGGDTDQEAEFVPEEELAQRIVDIITEYVEPEQWTDNGGDGGTIRYFSGHIMVRAPDYMHRQLSGYPFGLGRPASKSAAK
jgi:hypothetical protein